MANKPKISIIIPVYNVEKYLEQCLKSLINQTFKDIEIICINDGSTDNSLEILEAFQKQDERIKIINKQNEGQGIARNEGLKIAKGEYISFIDPDDWVEQGMYEFLYNKFLETNAQIIRFNYRSFDEEKQISDKPHNFRIEQAGYFKLNIQDNSIYNWKNVENLNFEKVELQVWNRIFSNKFIKENNLHFAPFKHSEDNIFTISALFLADKILYVEKVFYNYRVRNNSSLNRASNEYFSVFKNVELIKDFLIEKGLFEKYEKAYRIYLIDTFYSHYGCIPNESIEIFLDEVRKRLTKEEYKKFKNLLKAKFTFFEKLFALKNIKMNGKKRKILNILGLTFVISK